MRIAALALIALAFLAACESEPTEQPAPAAPIAAVDVAVSDELPGLSAPATGIAFWDHPALSFNSLLIVASAEGVVSYNIEDGNEVSRLTGINAQGAAVSYLGLGPQAAGVLAIFDGDESAFKLFGVDNASRAFFPISGGPAIRGNVRGYCFDRAIDAAAPTLFVVQKSKLSIFNFEQAEDGLTVASETALETPDDLVACAVDIDGVVLAAGEKGALYRVAGADSFSSPFARTDISDIGGIAILATEATDGDETSVNGQIAMLESKTGALHLYDRTDGRALGVVTITATDELDGVSAASAMSATTGNLGGLYRNGAFALGVDGEDAPAIRLIPVNGVINRLSLPEGAAISPRGALPETEDAGLQFDVGFEPQ